MKKIIGSCLLALASMSTQAQSRDKLDYGNAREQTFYVSNILYYAGYDECGNDYDFKRKAERAFEAHLRANYNVKQLRIGRTFSTRVNSTEKLKTRQQAEEKMNNYIAEERDDKYDVRKTNFSYSCEK